ncbi:MAG: hypothetical protein STHCBS139747_005711 [Sporothrix thermara]
MGAVTVTVPPETSLSSTLPYRTAADEAGDYKDAVERAVNKEFVDWPNEAGFEDLCEERGPIQIPVVGSIPVWAAGNLYRTGPGGRKIEGTPKGDFMINHWFDGLAHTHRFEIAPTVDGKGTEVFYSSRRQCEARIKYIQEHGASELFTFAQRSDPCVGMLGKLMSTFRAAALRRQRTHKNGIENVNVVVHFDMPGMAVSSQATKDDAAQLPTTMGHRTTLPSDLWISTDANHVQRLDPATLEPIGVAAQNHLHPELTGPLSCAHGHRDPATGDMLQYNLELGATPVYRVFRVSAATGSTSILATIRCRSGRLSGASLYAAGPEAVRGSAQTVDSSARPAYIHSFFMSEHYVVLCIPCTHIAHNGLKLLWARNVIDGIEPFSPANKTRWIVIDKQPQGRGVVAEFESDAAFFFHSINAYEEADARDGGDGGGDDGGGSSTRIVCDVIQYASSALLTALQYDVLTNRNNAGVEFYANPDNVKNSTAHLRRFHLCLPPIAADAASPKVRPAELAFTIASPHVGELPTINGRCYTRPHRYVYSVGNHGRSTLADSIVKTDTATRASLVWHAPQAHTPGEAIFVQRPVDQQGVQDEDDGVLLSVVLDGFAAKSYLLCLDARTMKEVGRAEVGFAIGFGFHGAHAKSG